MPGVTFNGPDQMDIRGSTGFAKGVGSRVLMLLDGHPVLSADGGEIDFNSLPLIDLSRTEVVKGAYSAVYGSGALGGVVNLITQPLDERPTTAVRAHFDAYDTPSNYSWTDEFQSAQGLGVQHSRSIGDVGVRAYVGYDKTDGYTQNGGDELWMARVKVGSLPGAAHAWDAFALYTNSLQQEFFVWRADSTPFEVAPQYVGDHELDQKFPVGRHDHGDRHRQDDAAAQPVHELERDPERLPRQPGPSLGDQAGNRSAAGPLAVGAEHADAGRGWRLYLDQFQLHRVAVIDRRGRLCAGTRRASVPTSRARWDSGRTSTTRPRHSRSSW